MQGPSHESRINLSSVSVLSLFLGSVLILFIVENPLSTSAVDTGRVRAIHANLEIVRVQPKMNFHTLFA